MAIVIALIESWTRPMPEVIHTVDEVFGVARDLPLNYVTRPSVDGKLIDNLARKSHIVIYGSSKQGKTSLRKYCLKDGDYEVVSCQNRWQLADLHAAILKECGYVVHQSTTKTVSGANKIVVKFDGKIKIPFFAEGQAGATYDNTQTTTTETKTVELELDPSDVNDVIRALDSIEYKNHIILEDFHYLPDETQRDMAFSLKAFHEKSKITFVIVGVWREENRLITYNGDLTDRVFSVDVDTWDTGSLLQVIEAGEHLLNLQFDQNFKDELIANCFESVHIVQEVCRRCLRHEEIFQTLKDHRIVGSKNSAKDFVAEVINDQGGRYNGFLMNFADGFQQTDLEMPKWIIYAILSSPVETLEKGLRLREISRMIKEKHPKGDSLNNGNITQALISASSLQVKKNVRPIIIDYDTTNRNLQVVDKGFLIWLANNDRAELLADLDLPLDDDPTA